MRPDDIQDKDIPTADPGRLIIQYTPLCYRIAERYRTALDKIGAVDLDDLIQAGRIAIYNAQRTYDPEGGASFTSYIFDRIRTAMQRTMGIRDGKYPVMPLSLDEPISDDSDIVRGDAIPDKTPTAEETIIEQDGHDETAEAVHAAVNRMKSEKQREVIRRVWLDGQERNAVAADLGTTVTAVRALDQEGRRTLRRDIRLKQYAMPFFQVGVQRFNSTWTSAVEMAVIWLDQHRTPLPTDGGGAPI